MKFICHYNKSEAYLPTPRCRKYRRRLVESTTTVEIKEVKMTAFPLAFQHPVMEWNSSKCTKRNVQYRSFDGNLYTRMGGFRTTWYTVPALMQKMRNCLSYSFEYKEEEAHQKAQEIADDFLIVRSGAHSEVWMKMGEPMYEICTFGLGYNHGGTGMFISNAYNGNLPKEWYFNALHYEGAVKKAISVAEARGDTNSVETLREADRIQVFMPELVKRNPEVEGGDGDEFHRDVETIANATNDPMEASLLVIKRAIENIRKEH